MTCACTLTQGERKSLNKVNVCHCTLTIPSPEVVTVVEEASTRARAATGPRQDHVKRILSPSALTGPVKLPDSSSDFREWAVPQGK